MKKKLFSLFIANVILLSCFAFSLSAYGKTQQLILDTKMTYETDGADDKGIFTYTPDASGTFSFLSYNVPASEVYLYVKEIDPQTGEKKYVQLAYSNSDPDYEKNNHNRQQFCLTYHLNRGVTYYFHAGWLFESRTSGTMTVMLTCNEYDDKCIENITVSCPVTAKLNVYADGNWMTDANGERYYYYNPSKIISNMTVTVYYSTGEVSSVTGKTEIDGYTIRYLNDQLNTHWYPKEHPNYTANIITVKILDVTADYNVDIISSARYPVQGVVKSMNGEYIKEAQIYCGSELLATSSATGYFSFSYPAGQYTLTVKAPGALARTATIIVSTTAKDNNYVSQPINLYTCDYVQDGIINTKDYAKIKKLTDDALMKKDIEQYSSAIHYTSKNYEDLNIYPK